MLFGIQDSTRHVSSMCVNVTYKSAQSKVHSAAEPHCYMSASPLYLFQDFADHKFQRHGLVPETSAHVAGMCPIGRFGSWVRYVCCRPVLGLEVGAIIW